MSPIEGKLPAPLLSVGKLVFDEFIEFCVLPALFLPWHFLYHCCIRYPPLLGCIKNVVSVVNVLSNLINLTSVFPLVTLRQFCSHSLNLRIVFFI